MKKLHFILVPVALVALITMPAVAADKPDMVGSRTAAVCKAVKTDPHRTLPKWNQG